MATQDKTADKKDSIQQYVAFEIDGEEYGVRLTDLKEIIKIPELTPLPNAADFFAGVFNLRGKIVPVIDLEKRFHLKRERQVFAEHILVTEQENDLYGMIVDKVLGTVRVSDTSIQKPQHIGNSGISEEYINGIAAIKDEKTSKNRLIILLNVSKILSTRELIELASQRKETLINKNTSS